MDFNTLKHTSAQNVSDVIQDAIQSAKALVEKLENAKLIGLEKGQYTAANLATFNTAIQVAGEGSADRNKLNTLTQARKDFLASVVTVDRSKLVAVITKAETTLGTVVEGDKNGNYEVGSKAVFEEAISKAKAVLEDGTITQEQAKIDDAVTALNSASTALTAKKVVINFTALKEAVSKAEKAYSDNDNDLNKGDESGQIPASAFATLREVITSAEKVIGENKDNVNQVAVDAKTTELANAVTIFLSSRKPLDKSLLNEIIKTVDEGLTKYPSESHPAKLLQELANAKTVQQNESATQAEVNSARSKLNTQWVLFLQTMDLESDEFAQIEISTKNEVLYVNNLPNDASISIYSLNGNIVYNQRIAGDSVTVPLNSGVYIMNINILNNRESFKVVIR